MSRDERLDRIYLSEKEIEKLFEWRDKNKELVRNCKYVLEKGVIIITESYRVYFELNGYNLRLVVKFDDNVAFEFEFNALTTRGEIIKNVFPKDIDADEYAQTVLSVYSSLMAYMEHYGDKKEYVEARKTLVSKPSKNKKSKGKGKKSSKVKISRTVYKVYVDDNESDEKRAYERKTEAWSVRGHYRTYKSGKKVWIKPTVKGKGKEIGGKEYIL